MMNILYAFKKENGQSFVLFSILMVVFLGFSALVMDIGMTTVSKAEIQNAADSAALAGAMELPDNPSQAITVAREYAALNGKPGDFTDVTVGDDNNSITVTIRRNSSTAFAKIFGVHESTAIADATAKVGIAASVPWIVPFVIPKPDYFDYDQVYVMRMYGKGAYLDYPDTGYPRNYNYPSDYRTHTVYRNYPLSNPYPYQFDYMNVYIRRNTNFNNYIHWLEYGYHETFSINDYMYYLGPSSGGQESVDAFARRVSRDPNTDYRNAKVGDSRVMLIPVVESMLKRNTSTRGDVPIQIIGFVGFFIEKVHKNSYGESFWFEGRFLENFNVGSGEVTFDTDADFGLRVVKLVD